jgi:hypothetical protein
MQKLANDLIRTARNSIDEKPDVKVKNLIRRYNVTEHKYYRSKSKYSEISETEMHHLKKLKS